MSEEQKKFNLDIDAEDFENLGILALKLEESGDVKGAVLLLKLGAHLGDTWTTTMLADYLSEPPAFIDVKTAELLYKKSCLAGSSAACNNLSVLYWQLGKTVQAQKYWQMAKDRGSPWADEGPPWENTDDE
jgi:TPR repeat protein